MGKRNLGVWCLYFVWRVDWDVYCGEIFAFHVKEGTLKIDTSGHGKVCCETNKIERFLKKETTSSWTH